MKLKFKKEDFVFLMPNILEYVNSLDDSEYDFTIKKHKDIRSLKANNFSWTLTDELAEKMLVAGVKISKDEMHAEMIFRYGQVMVDDNGEQVIISTAQEVDVSKVFPYAKEIGTGTVNGKEFTHYRIYRGSHTYDTKEMSLFIKGIVEECKEQGINVDTPEIRALLEAN
jgi:hypothetical protein